MVVNIIMFAAVCINALFIQNSVLNAFSGIMTSLPSLILLFQRQSFLSLSGDKGEYYKQY